MLGETLQDGSNTHDQRTRHDGQSSTESLVEPRGDGNSENGAELVARRDKTKQASFDSPLALCVFEAIAEI